MSSNKTDENGFTLLEVIVALAIMAAGFVTVLQLFSKSMRSVETTDQYLKAISLAHSKMSALELDDFVTTQFSGFFDGESEYSWFLEYLPYPTFLNDPENMIEVFQVRLNVLWQEAGRPKNVELVSLRTVGRIYTATDKVLLGKATGGIYGNLVGAQASPSKNSDTEDAPKVKFCGKEVAIPNISGFGSNPELHIS